MSVQKRIRGGQIRWVARYRGPDGKERSKTFDTKKSGKDWVADRRLEMRDDEWIDPASQTVTVGRLWADWERSARSPGTEDVRKQVAANLGRLKDVEIGRLRPSLIREWQHELTSGRSWADGKKLAPSTAKNYAGQLAGCLARAVDDGLLRKSPMPKVSTRQVVQPVMQSELLSIEQVWQLVDAANGGRAPFPTLARMMIVGAATGLRAGEIGGLRIRSVDFLRREMSVIEQSQKDTSRFEWRPLKTEASKRTIPLPQVAIDALAAELKDRPCADRSMPVFRARGGGMWSSTAIGKAFAARRTAVGLDEAVTWHSLRHFYASTLIQSGASVKTVQDRLGHSTPTTTLETYVHLWPGEDERTRAAVDEAMVRDGCGTEGSEAASE